MNSELLSLIVLIGVVWGALAGIQALQTAQFGAEAEVRSLLDRVPRQRWHFIALEYCYGILNRTYAVFVTDRMLSGAKVRGLLSAPTSPNQRWRDPYFYPRTKLVTSYASLDPESPSFKAVHSSNFQLSMDQIERVEFDNAPKWGMGTVPYSGRIFLHLRSGAKRELILLGDQPGSELAERLRKEGIGRAPTKHTPDAAGARRLRQESFAGPRS